MPPSLNVRSWNGRVSINPKNVEPGPGAQEKLNVSPPATAIVAVKLDVF